MNKPLLAVLLLVLGAAALFLFMRTGPPEEPGEVPKIQELEDKLDGWTIHDPERPLPAVVDPGPAGPPTPAPSDAVILFSGTDLSQWTNAKGGDPGWKIKNGSVEVVKKAGSILTKKEFGDCQLHVEWAAPLPASGKSQGRGNSGVFLMNTYEVQILDCFENITYADGMTSALYGQFPPRVNACRSPGEWQTFDILFFRPHFDAQGKVIEPARMTVFFNGLMVHHNRALIGPTTWKVRTPYSAHADRLPVSLQDHGNPVRYRNIWIRDLEK
jgi:hypothetical protein